MVRGEKNQSGSAVRGALRVKSQAPNPKLQRTPKSQLPNPGDIWKVEVGSALGFGAWSLGFGALQMTEQSPLTLPHGIIPERTRAALAQAGSRVSIIWSAFRHPIVAKQQPAGGRASGASSAWGGPSATKIKKLQE